MIKSTPFDLKQAFSRDYENSVFRRSGVLLAFLIPASLANFAVVYFMTVVLSPEQFGLFFVANTLGNVFFSGSLILNMFFARHFVMVVREHGEKSVFSTVNRVGNTVVIWGALFAAIAIVVMIFVSNRFGVQSLALVPLIVLDAYTSYVADVGRAFFQSTRRTVSLGMYTLMWMTCRLLFCLIGVFIFRTAFGALLGIVLSTVIAYIGFRFWTTRQVTNSGVTSPLPSPNALIPSIVGYGLLIAISNLDVLLTYFVLKHADVGIYSASSIFPKAMLVVTLPLVQILFPGMMGSTGSSSQEKSKFAFKSGLAMAVITTGGVVAIWLLSGFLCGGKWGVKLCAPNLLAPLLFSVVPLSLLRVLVLLQFARRRDWIASSLVLPTIAYFFVAGVSHWDANGLAKGFSIFSAACLMFLFCVHLVAEQRAEPAPKTVTS
jgi:O-antigen/teichoic acid export membrane protein